eukprot:m.82490 g.82490  ORF g.82490 m.82490 type:complete len:325 (-) comp25520_c2_seq1:155-1129(-)
MQANSSHICRVGLNGVFLISRRGIPDANGLIKRRCDGDIGSWVKNDTRDFLFVSLERNRLICCRVEQGGVFVHTTGEHTGATEIADGDARDPRCRCTVQTDLACFLGVVLNVVDGGEFFALLLLLSTSLGENLRGLQELLNNFGCHTIISAIVFGVNLHLVTSCWLNWGGCTRWLKCRQSLTSLVAFPCQTRDNTARSVVLIQSVCEFLTNLSDVLTQFKRLQHCTVPFILEEFDKRWNTCSIWRTGLYNFVCGDRDELVNTQRLSICRICWVVDQMFLNQPFFKHCPRDRRKHRFFGHFSGNSTYKRHSRIVYLGVWCCSNDI